MTDPPAATACLLDAVFTQSDSLFFFSFFFTHNSSDRFPRTVCVAQCSVSH
eukprot:m.167364 g.167364  ORF g.167364 m.167364 type:complete len:51 (-) comp17193_c0_seq5:3396-3548(-)